MKKFFLLQIWKHFSKTLYLCTLITLSACSSPHSRHSANAWPSNKAIQNITDDVVEDAKKTLTPKGICVIVAEPQTGKMLAINGEVGRFLTEPVSTFKPVVVAAALEKGKISESTKINCEQGVFIDGNGTIKDSIPLGELDYSEILQKSSNIGTSKIALLLDDKEFFDFVRSFGYGQKTGISMPSEISGFLQDPSRWQSQSKMRMAIGQQLAATPIQIAMAYCAIVNGGNLMRPAIGNEKPQIVRRVCSEKTSKLLKKALHSATLEGGSAAFARVPSVATGGKTGTAQAVTPDGRYSPAEYVTLFAGFFPVENPKYVVIVAVDQATLPPKLNYGGLVAAPIFAEIAKKISTLPSK